MKTSPQMLAAVPFPPFGMSKISSSVGSRSAFQTLAGSTAMVTSTIISSVFRPVPVCQLSSPKSAKNGRHTSDTESAVRGSAPVISAKASRILPLSAPLLPTSVLI